jgi:arylsulfatase A-like enzyme
MQTGQYATSNGVTTNSGTLPTVDYTIARVFDRAGYETGYIGKWHLAGRGTDPIPRDHRGGYDHWVAADILEFTSHPYEGMLYDSDDEPVRFDGYRVNALTEMAIEFVEEASDEPFFCFLSYVEPHHQNDMKTYVAPDGYAWQHRNPWVPPDLRDHSGHGDWYEELPDYYGICERIDECYGQLLDALDQNGVLEDTIVVFTSDHGSHFRTRNEEYKRSCHESSIRVPGVIRGPGFDEDVSELVNLVDIPPTLVDACGLQVPGEMEGESIAPLAGGEHRAWKDDVFVQPISSEEVARTLRTDRWKYSVYAPRVPEYEEGSDTYTERYLYDLHSDPYERSNLVGRSDYREVRDRLRERLLARIRDVEGVDVNIVTDDGQIQ